MSAARRYSQSRRRFVGLLGWAGAVAVAPGGPALAVAARTRRDAANPPPVSPEKQPAATPENPEASEDARALAAVLERRYGEHWSAEQLKSVTLDLDGDLKAAQRLREMKLGNGEEPDFTFKA